MKGGYTVISLSGYNFTAGTALTVKGLYERIEGNYKKAILIEGLAVGSVESHGGFTQAVVSSEDYVLDLADYKITVTKADSVTVTAQGA